MHLLRTRCASLVLSFEATRFQCMAYGASFLSVHRRRLVSLSRRAMNMASRQRMTHRPGYNSYLKVDLEEQSMQSLFDLSLTIKAQLEEAYHIENSIRSKEVKNGRIQVTPLFHIKPRSLESLHMTLFFGGESISALPAEDLIKWHSLVSNRLADAGFVVGATKRFAVANAQRSVSETDLDFTVTEICTFPPQRHSLVVAKLSACPAWHELYNDIRNISRDIPGLHDVVTNQGFDVWTPHITLANIVRGKSHDSSRDQYQLNLAATKSILQSFRVGGTHSAARGISMGGPIPKQAALNWNFRSSLGEQITRQI
jgi:2'-5' RNA ligase